MRLAQAGCCIGVAFGITALLSSSTGCSSTTQVRQVFMALDGTGARVRDTFFTDSQSILCDVLWSGRGTDNTVDAVFVQHTGEATLFDGSNVINPLPGFRTWGSAEQAPPSGVSTFAFTLSPPTSVSSGRPLPYPVGDWTCEIYVNGEHAASTPFHIHYPDPDCPSGDATSSGNSCVPYMSNATCPAASDNTKTCTCSGANEARTWNCP